MSLSAGEGSAEKPGDMTLETSVEPSCGPRIIGAVLSVAALPLPLSRRVLAAPDTVFSSECIVADNPKRRNLGQPLALAPRRLATVERTECPVDRARNRVLPVRVGELGDVFTRGVGAKLHASPRSLGSRENGVPRRRR